MRIPVWVPWVVLLCLVFSAVAFGLIWVRWGWQPALLAFAAGWVWQVSGRLSARFYATKR